MFAARGKINSDIQIICTCACTRADNKINFIIEIRGKIVRLFDGNFVVMKILKAFLIEVKFKVFFFI